jgi:hypothetical protein
LLRGDHRGNAGGQYRGGNESSTWNSHAEVYRVIRRL